MTSNFNKSPEVTVTGMENECFSGWDAIAGVISHALAQIAEERKVVAVECYQGVDDSEVLHQLIRKIQPDLVILTAELMHSEADIRRITFPDVTDDRIFGYLTQLQIEDFLDPEKTASAALKINQFRQGTILVYGPGASIVYPHLNLLIYADMARWEIQQRMRRNEVNNLGILNREESTETRYKRGYFVDWRVCDKLKKRVLPQADYILDTNTRGRPLMITQKAFVEGLKQYVSRPFSVVPDFDAGPWGGQWMKEKFNLDPSSKNYAWCFNCVPEENSLYLRFGKHRFETPAINLVFFKPVELLGDPVHARFGDEFPIRFDYLDTMGGGNLSLQVHPVTEYIREHFGIPYTQDESYYLLDAEPGARVFLGLKEGIRPEAMISALKEAQDNGVPFDDAAFVESWPAAKHDHFLIPGGTVHCSGKGCMVLEISATPYIFTFKLWDWGRLGLDGKPRPINIEHGNNNIRWHRTTSWVKNNLVNQVSTVARGDGWHEEKTGLHEREFIETRRHWFTKKVHHHTNGGVNVLALVEGREVIVESPTDAFSPFVVHYAETFIVPACTGEYTIRPSGESEGMECATIKAFVRVNA